MSRQLVSKLEEKIEKITTIYRYHMNLAKRSRFVPGVLLCVVLIGLGPLAARTETDPETTVREAGELIADGKSAQAADLIRSTIRQCDRGDSDIRDCGRWMRALRGLETLIADAPEPQSLTNSLGMTMVRIPAGEYMMGSLRQEMDWVRLTFRKTWREGHKQWFQDELPLHPVRITSSFYIGATEVTVGQFREFVKSAKYKTDAEEGDGGMIFDVGENRWVPKKEYKWNATPWPIADDQPVVFVSWNDATAFCQWLSRKEKRTYRLPTEAEWEMGCRGGLVWSRYPWGNRLPGGGDTNFGDGNPKLPESLTMVNDGYQYVSPVASFPPNGLGLYDMAGNVMEWVQDRYDRNYYESSPLEDPKGPDIGTARVNKGGNFYASPADGRCAFRGFSGPEMSFWNLGFRVVMEESYTAPKTAADRNSGSNSEEPAGSTDLPPTHEDGIRLFRQAMNSASQQQWDAAVEDLEKALEIYRQRKDYKWIARTKATLAGIYAERDRRFKSKELYTEALAEFRKIGDTNSARIILARLQDLETSPGVEVVKVRSGSTAEKAGIVAGDIIMEYAGETGFKVQGFKQLVNDYSRVDKVTLSVFNEDVITTLVVPGGTLGVAVKDIKRPRRPRRVEDDDNRQRPRNTRGRDRRSRRR